jgi:hypothetical protein
MADFDPAWAVMCLDVSDVDGDEAAVVSVLRVYRSEEGARAEVYRHRAEDANEDHHYFYEATEVERVS